MVEVSPSLLAVNLAELKADLARVSAAQIFHLDIMDGHFVPNISLGTNFLATIRPLIKGQINAHLMVTNPASIYPLFIKYGADSITIHQEVIDDELELITLLRKIRKEVPVGIAINPGTDHQVLAPYLSEVDEVLLMSVQPGWGGQAYQDVSAKVVWLDAMRKKHNLQFQIAVDGGVNDAIGASLAEKGVNILVMGSYLFNHDNPNQIINSMQKK